MRNSKKADVGNVGLPLATLGRRDSGHRLGGGDAAHAVRQVSLVGAHEVINRRRPSLKMFSMLKSVRQAAVGEFSEHSERGEHAEQDQEHRCGCAPGRQIPEWFRWRNVWSIYGDGDCVQMGEIMA